MKFLVFLPILLSVGLCQYSYDLLGDIPAKIHSEIFAPHLTSPYAFPKTIPSIVPYRTSLMLRPIRFDYEKSLLQNYTTSKIPSAKDLFAPAIVKTPAATKGQIEAYKKALKEEAEEELKEQLKNQEKTLLGSQGYLLSLESKAVSYVNVKLGGPQNVKYQYQSSIN